MKRQSIIPNGGILVQRIGLNVLWLVLSRISSQALSALLVIFVARRLGQSGLGQYAFITAVVFLGNTLSTFGLDTLIIREIGASRRTGGALLGAALWLQLALSLGLIAAISLSGSFLPNKSPETVLALQIYSLSLIPLAFYTLFSATLRAFERMDLFLVLNLISGLIQAGGGIILLLAGARLLSFIVYLLVSQVLIALVAAIMCATRLPDFSFQWKVPLILTTQLIQRGWPLASLTVLAILYQKMGILILSLISTDAVTGWFTAAARIIEALKIAHYAFLGALFPVLARISYRDRRQTPEVEKSRFLGMFQVDSLRLLLGLSLVLATGVTLLAGPLVQLLFGAKFAASIPAVRVLVWSLIPYAYSANKSLEFVTKGDERLVLKVTLFSAFLSGFLFMILTPTLNLVGASLAGLAGESVQAVAYLPLTRNRSSRRATSPVGAFFSSRRSTHNRIDPVP